MATKIARLNTSRFLFWGYLKSKVYETPVQNLQELQNRIVHYAQLIDEDMIRRAVENFNDRIAYCQEVNGRHFEQLL